jgi:hypothetical protein
MTAIGDNAGVASEERQSIEYAIASLLTLCDIEASGTYALMVSDITESLWIALFLLG